MRKKAKILVILPLLLLLMNITGNYALVKGQSNDVIISDPEVIILVPGETKRVKIPLQSTREIVQKPVVMADAKDAPFSLSQPKFDTDDLDLPFVLITPYAPQYVVLDIDVDDTAKIGIYTFDLIVTGEYYTFDGGEAYSKLTITTQILDEKAPAQLTVDKVSVDDQTIGNDINLSFTVKNEGEINARNVYVSIDYKETGMIAGYTTKTIKIGDIDSQLKVPVKLPIKILPIATPGIKALTINLEYKTGDGTPFKESHDVYINLKENDNAPDLSISDFTYNDVVKPGEQLGLVLNIKNSGSLAAVNPRIYVDESSVGSSKFIKDFFTEYIELRDIKNNQTIKVDVPLIVSKTNKGGEQDIKLNLVYFDAEGVEYKSTVTIYPYIEAEGISEDGKPIVIISNVLQSPKQPVAGGRLEVSFDMENKSTIDLNEFKISLGDLSTKNTFIPVKAEPYLYFGTLKAGEIKRVNIPLTVSEEIQEGLNNLTINYSYIGDEDTVNIPILDVQNDLGSASKPRLIVSKYEADIEELRAGSVFNFNFDIRNTHSSVAAKNIIITLSGKSSSGQEIFSVTQGSNSFFVSKIGPGETFSGMLEMKVKSDAATSAYPIKVTIEYEYDGIEPNPTTGKIGETEEHELNLQVIENARPVVDRVDVYSWDRGVVVGNPATLSFEFYNMGKSTLNNVIATVEGDFVSSGGSMYFMGNVVAGGNAYAEFEVIPNVEGTAYGVLKITYEDSNGEEQVYTKEFEAFVMGEQIWDPGMNGDDGIGVYNPIVPEPKKVIMPVWLFVVLQVAILIIFMPISRKVIINIYKSRLRKKDEEMY